MMTLVNFDEAVIHLMQLSLVISSCNITFSVFWPWEGSVATLIRWGGWRLSRVAFICMSNSENCIKIHWFLRKLQKKISWFFCYCPCCSDVISLGKVYWILCSTIGLLHYLRSIFYVCLACQLVDGQHRTTTCFSMYWSHTHTILQTDDCFILTVFSAACHRKPDQIL